MERREFLLLSGLGTAAALGLAGTSAPRLERVVIPELLRPVSEIPVDAARPIRQRNWNSGGAGSCMHASWMTHLRWVGMPDVATWWGQHSGGRGGVQHVRAIADRIGLKYASTEKENNVGFLEWASRTRRGAAVYYFDDHAVTFCGFLNGLAWVIDNNSPDQFISVPHDEFTKNWCRYGSGAITAIGSPPAPRGWTRRSDHV